VGERQRMFGKKTMENEILREAISQAPGPKKNCQVATKVDTPPAAAFDGGLHLI
jgi:hypothetical protein